MVRSGRPPSGRGPSPTWLVPRPPPAGSACCLKSSHFPRETWRREARGSGSRRSGLLARRGPSPWAGEVSAQSRARSKA